MPHELHASICIVLPNSPRELADAISTATGAWSEMLAKLEPNGVVADLAINDTKQRKAAGTDGVKRGRKPKAPAQIDGGDPGRLDLS